MNKLYEGSAPRGNVMINEFKEKAGMALAATADALSVTLGPLGSSVFLEDQFLQHAVTKDGYTVISKMAFADPVEKGILNYMQKVSSRLNRTVGDGTTTAVVVAAELCRAMEDLKKSSGINDSTLTSEVLSLVNEVALKLKDGALRIESKDDEPTAEGWKFIESVATVSANNDPVVGSRVVEALKVVGIRGTMAAKPATGPHATTVFTSGMEVERGMILPAFMNNQDDKSFEVGGQVHVFMSEEPLGAPAIMGFSKILNQVCIVKKGALVIIAPGYDEHFIGFLLENKMKMREELPIVAIDIATRSSAAKDRFDDLATYASCIPMSPNLNGSIGTMEGYMLACCSFGKDSPLGAVADAKVTEKRTVLVGTLSEDKCRDRTIKLQVDLEELLDKDCESKEILGEASLLRQRIRALSGSGVATLYVGGDSEQEKKARTYLVEDAVCAAKSALVHGVLPGCCLETMAVLHRISQTKLTEERKNLVVAFSEAYIKFYARVIQASPGSAMKLRDEYIRNGEVPDISTSMKLPPYTVGNFRKGKVSTGLLTSAQSDVEILRSAASIATLIATSGAFVSWNTIFDPPGPRSPQQHRSYRHALCKMPPAAETLPE